jgi:hypothetical protein
LNKLEAKNISQADFDTLMNVWLDKNDPLYKTLDDVPSWWKDDTAAIVKVCAIKGDGVNSLGVRQSTVKATIIIKRYAD